MEVCNTMIEDKTSDLTIERRTRILNSIDAPSRPKGLGAPNALCYSADGGKLAVEFEGAVLAVSSLMPEYLSGELTKHTPSQVYDLKWPVGKVLWSHWLMTPMTQQLEPMFCDSDRLLVTFGVVYEGPDKSGQTVEVWDADDGTFITGWSLGVLGAVPWKAVSPRSPLVATVSASSCLEIRSAETGDVLQKLSAYGAVQFTPDGQSILALDRPNGAIVIWEFSSAVGNDSSGNGPFQLSPNSSWGRFVRSGTITGPQLVCPSSRSSSILSFSRTPRWISTVSQYLLMGGSPVGHQFRLRTQPAKPMFGISRPNEPCLPLRRTSMLWDLV